MEENQQVQQPVAPAAPVPPATNPTTAPRKSKKLLLATVLGSFMVVILILIGGIAFYMQNIAKQPASTNPVAQKPIVIGFSLGSLQEERWQIDREEFVKRAEAAGVTVDVQGANNDANKQISQLEGMIQKGVNVLVIVPFDATSLSGVITDAHKAGIKVISYDRLITNSDVDYYVSFDNEKVGRFEAQPIVDAVKTKLDKGNKLKFAYVGGPTTDNNVVLLKKGAFSILQPLIDKGQIQMVFDQYTPGWDPDKAYQNLKAYLDKSNGAVDAVVCGNDGTAFGAIKALQEHALAGKVPVSGQDAELSALQRIIAGTQTATVYKPIPRLAAAALQMALELSTGKTVTTNAKVSDGKVDVLSYLLEPTLVTKDNIEQTVVKDNYHTKAEIYGK
jgi:D-xylose transport system substrate-binding protein